MWKAALVTAPRWGVFVLCFPLNTPSVSAQRHIQQNLAAILCQQPLKHQEKWQKTIVFATMWHVYVEKAQTNRAATSVCLNLSHVSEPQSHVLLTTKHELCEGQKELLLGPYSAPRPHFWTPLITLQILKALYLHQIWTVCLTCCNRNVEINTSPCK